MRKLFIVLFSLGIWLVFSGYSFQNKTILPSSTPVSTPYPSPKKSTDPVLGTKDFKAELVPREGFFLVTKVIDGDTIDVEINEKKETIRLIGIDTPEEVDPRKPVQCFAKEASNKAKEVLTGKSVRLEADTASGERDKYNRLLRYVFLEDQTNFNKMMVKEGYAYEYTYQNVSYKYQQEFKQAEKDARENKRGLWAEEKCSGKTSSLPSDTKTALTQSPTAPVITGSWTCAGKTKCTQMTNCEEAYFYLKNCALTKLDKDGDGVPCESICK